MKLEDCKVGIKVMVIGKTAGDSTASLNGKLFPAHARGWGYIHQVYRDIRHIFLSNTSGGSQEWGAYHAADLEPYIEPEEKEYRQLKDITPRAIFDAQRQALPDNVGNCFMKEFTRFIAVFNIGYDAALFFEEVMDELEVEPEWTDWFIKHGFIERVVEEKPKEVVYAVGERFIESGTEEYLLAQPNAHEAFLVNLGNGNRWKKPIKVGSSKAITEVEFDEITGQQPPSNFTKIEEK